MKRINVLIVLSVAVPMLMLVGCKKKEAQSSSVRFMLTDAPGEFDEVNVDIEAIEVHTEADGWVTLNSNLGVVNLLDYMNGQTTLITEGEITAGKITEARLVLGTENSVVVDGVTYQLSSPSALQTGLHVTLNNQLQAGGDYEFTIDFDAAQSIAISAGGSYILKPTLRLIADGSTFIDAGGSGSINVGGGGTGGVSVDGGGAVVNGDVTGTISGSVSSTTGLAFVYATDAQGNVTSTMTGLSGNFTLQAIQSGSYTITIDPVLPMISSKVMSSVSVSAGQTIDLGLVTL
jgi:hypothetical protein